MAAPLAPTKPNDPTSSTPAPTTPPSPPSPSAPSPTSPFAGLSGEEKDRLLAQQSQVIRENARKTAEMEARLNALSKKVDEPAPVPLDMKTENKKFFDSPAVALAENREQIKKDLIETVKPLIEFKNTFEKGSQYERLKASTKSDPRFKDFLALPGVEAMVDQMMEKLPASPDAMYSVLVGLRGSMEFGDINKPGAAAPPAPARTGDPIQPPHLRPTPPPLPDREPGSDKEAAYLKGEVEKLDENARRLIREMGMTAEEYVRWRDEEAINVPSSKIGIKPPAKEGAKA